MSMSTTEKRKNLRRSQKNRKEMKVFQDSFAIMSHMSKIINLGEGKIKMCKNA